VNPATCTPYSAKVRVSLSFPDRVSFRGEQTASVLESRLSEVEDKIDQLLASVQAKPDLSDQNLSGQSRKENGNPK
jgi:hypothetical protein